MQSNPIIPVAVAFKLGLNFPSPTDEALIYITSWAILGAQRIIVWDIPFMGIEFSMYRLLISIPLPIIAGLLARRMA